MKVGLGVVLLVLIAAGCGSPDPAASAPKPKAPAFMRVVDLDDVGLDARVASNVEVKPISVNNVQVPFIRVPAKKADLTITGSKPTLAVPVEPASDGTYSVYVNGEGAALTAKTISGEVRQGSTGGVTVQITNLTGKPVTVSEPSATVGPDKFSDPLVIDAAKPVSGSAGSAKWSVQLEGTEAGQAYTIVVFERKGKVLALPMLNNPKMRMEAGGSSQAG